MGLNQWKPKTYDDQFNYVSNFGKSVVELLAPQKGETILDLGCGTGDLSYEITQFGSKVTGMDTSTEMIVEARKKYPSITFTVDNGETFRTNEKYDAVFSNAALHWMKNPEKVINSVQQALNVGGRFVAEFGGKGNVETVVQGIYDVLHSEYGVDASQRNPWYFPSIGEYSSILEQYGFEVSYATHFNRPTKLPDGENGIDRFLDSFAGSFFPEFTKEEKKMIYAKIKEKIQSELFNAGIWVADYRRIRIMAIKKSNR